MSFGRATCAVAVGGVAIPFVCARRASLRCLPVKLLGGMLAFSSSRDFSMGRSSDLVTTHDDNAGLLPSPCLASDGSTADSTLRLRGGAASNRPGDADTPAGCCGLGWLFRSTSSRAEGREIDAPSRGAGMKINWNVHAQRIRDAAVMVSGATLWGLLRAPGVPSAKSKELDRGVPAAKEKKSFLENSLRARQLMLQGLEDGQLPPSPRYLLTLGVFTRASVFS